MNSKFINISLVIFAVCLLQVVMGVMLPYVGVDMSQLPNWYVYPLVVFFGLSSLVFMFVYFKALRKKWLREEGLLEKQ